MRAMARLLLFFVCLPSFALAGEIYGRIKVGKDYIEQGIKVEVEYNGGQKYTLTETFGSYRLYVPEKGKFIFRLYKDKDREPATITLYSFDKPARYDLVFDGNALVVK